MENAIGYRSDGHNKGEVHYSVKPRRLEWDLPPEVYTTPRNKNVPFVSVDIQILSLSLSLSLTQAVSRIEAELATVQASIANLDLYVLHHDMFGKGVIKRMGISPDGFIQMALQLAYYKVCFLERKPVLVRCFFF